ncbi:hypothetical protein Bhyg_12025, partial [Pseudolycoriella hygida]
ISSVSFIHKFLCFLAAILSLCDHVSIGPDVSHNNHSIVKLHSTPHYRTTNIEILITKNLIKIFSNFSKSLACSIPESIYSGNYTLVAIRDIRLSCRFQSTADLEEEYEEKILQSDTDDCNCPDFSNTINSFGKLIVDSHATTNPIPYSNLDTSPLQPRSGANSAYIEASKKRNRSEDTLPVDTTNPIKKHRSITDMFTMADAVKSDHVGHMVDIASTDDNKPLSKAQYDDIKCKITTALFTKQNISNIKFESSYFDGNKLRMICKNDETKAWLEETVPQLTDLLDGVKIHVINQGAPPKMVAVTISMPANTYEPLSTSPPKFLHPSWNIKVPRAG